MLIIRYTMSNIVKIKIKQGNTMSNREVPEVNLSKQDEKILEASRKNTIPLIKKDA